MAQNTNQVNNSNENIMSNQNSNQNGSGGGDNTPVNNINITPNSDNLFKSKTYVIKNNYWNDRHESILRSLQMNSNKLYKEYQKAHLVYKKKLRLYRIPIIIMSSLGGFLSISNSGYVPISYNKWVSMLVGFVNLMVTVISLIENFKKIDVNMNKTYSAYLEFKKLHDEISMVLNTPQNERENNGYDMANTFFSRYEMYLNDAPILGKALHDYLDENSPDNTTQTINQSSSMSKSPNESLDTYGDEDMYTEGEYNDLVDDLEAQKRLEMRKLRRYTERTGSKAVEGFKNRMGNTKQGLNNITNSQNSQKSSGILGFFGLGSSVSDELEEHYSMKNNLNSIKTNIKKSGRNGNNVTKSTEIDELNRNIFVKKQEMKKRAVEAVNKANKSTKNIKKQVETEAENEINSNMNRLEEEMKKLDDLEFKPSNLPILRNIKISEDLDTSSSKQDSKSSTKPDSKEDPDFIEIIRNDEAEYDFDSDSDN